MRVRLTFALAALFACSLLATAGAGGQRTPSRRESASHRGVSFTYDSSLANAVRAETVPATELGQGEVAPDVAPEHVTFGLAGVYPFEPRSFIQPEIKVYPLAAFRGLVAPSRTMTKLTEEAVRQLKLIARARSLPDLKQIPYLPVADGYRAFVAHARFIRFRNGRGLAFLTQGQQDEMPINNQNLSYEFLGLTDDGKFYVSAEFPVAAPFLENDRDRAKTDGVAPYRCVECPDHKRYMRQYRAYAGRIKSRLERLPPDAFRPRLGLYDDLLRSLEVRDPN